MRSFLFVFMLLCASAVFAEDAKKEEWHNTTLSDEVIAKIQQAQMQYKQCAATEMQKSDYANQDIRQATEVIVKACESVLADIREVYLDAEVPEVVADRHLKQLRIQTTRNILQELMYIEAAKKAGQ